MKHWHEFRDPIHNFIKVNTIERKFIDSYPFQRLRYIHQLAMTYMVYPGASHKRFEHSLGVMELAGRVFDTITDENNYDRHAQNFDLLEQLFPKSNSHLNPTYRQSLRIAALCHDMGHLPFSHAAEADLLPEGWNHEKLTEEIILKSDLTKIIRDNRLDPEFIAKLALGPKHYKADFNITEALLSEIITGNSFGVDRIDYLLRDSYHAGVAYGKFDHYRLLDTLRILPKNKGEEHSESDEPTLGIEEGGLQSAEAMQLARYFMFTQLYYHNVRRAYDIHLMDFLKNWLPGGKFSVNLNELLVLTDNEINAEMLKIAYDKGHPAHLAAKRVVFREHFKVLYERNSDDVSTIANILEQKKAANERKQEVIGPSILIYKAAIERFGHNNVRRDSLKQKPAGEDFPVLMKDASIKSSFQLSETLRKLQLNTIDNILIKKELYSEAQRWLEDEKDNILNIEREFENA